MSGSGNKRHFLERLKSFFNLGTVVHLPGQFKLFGISVSQDDDASLTISNDDKLQHIPTYCIPRLQRKTINEKLNAVEQNSFQSVNGSVDFLGMCEPICGVFLQPFATNKWARNCT